VFETILNIGPRKDNISPPSRDIARLCGFFHNRREAPMGNGSEGIQSEEKLEDHNCFLRIHP